MTIDHQDGNFTGIGDSEFIAFALKAHGSSKNWYDNVSKLSPKTEYKASESETLPESEPDRYKVTYYSATNSLSTMQGGTFENVAIVGNFDASLKLASPIKSISGYSSISGFNLSITRDADFNSEATTYGGLVNEMSDYSII